MTLLEQALEFRRRGWSAVPAHVAVPEGCSCGQEGCDAIGKHPRVRWQTYQRQLPSSAEITAWWKRWPTANLALITGAISGLVVLDIDPRHGGDVTLQRFPKLPETVTVLTGGGGLHYYFKHPGQRIKNGANLFARAPKEITGIDVRADGGYVIAPESLHSSGRQYLWEASCAPDMLPLADLPDWLLKELLAWTENQGFGEPVRQEFSIESVMAHGIPQGDRNETITRVAGHYARQKDDAKAMDKSLEELTELVLGVNNTYCKPPLGELEVKRICMSIYEREKRKLGVRALLESRTNGLIEKAELMDEKERLEAARSRWADLGIKAVTDWYLLKARQPEYVLETPGDEIHLGPSLLDFLLLQAAFVRDLHVLIPRSKAKTWERDALLLATFARDVFVETTKASERLDEWLEAYYATYPPSEPEYDRRREGLRSGPIKVEGRIHLRPTRLADYVVRYFGEKVTVGMVRKDLRAAGWEQTAFHSGNTKVRAWAEPQQVRTSKEP